MNRRHSALARQLIEKCGGLEEAAANCRVSKSVLSDAQNPNKPSSLAADVIEDLEEYCGEGVYSTAMSKRAHGIAPSLDIMGEMLDMQSSAATLAVDLHSFLLDHTFDQRERGHFLAGIEIVSNQLESIKAAALQPEPHLHVAAE